MSVDDLQLSGGVNCVDQWITDYAALYCGDSIELIDGIPDNSVGHSVFSPPFPGMYAYTNSPRDMGNCDHIDQMINHFRFLVGPKKLQRVMMPGRIVAIHLCQLTAMLSRDGYIGLKDYRGRVIRMMEESGWVFHGEVTIDKNPQVQAVRNKERGLLFKSLATDASVMRMALADYMLLFRKPGANPAPIPAGMSAKYNPGAGWITEQEWVRWARPVWYGQDWMPQDAIEVIINDDGIPEPRWVDCKDEGIRMTDVLNVAQARDTDDERHLCPLQLGVVKRSAKLWSNPQEIIFSPFMGVGSEGYQSVLLDRRFIGFELKQSYFESARVNLQEAWRLAHQQPTLFDKIAQQQRG